MADVNANIGVHIDTSATIAQLKALRAEISRFNQSVSKSSAAAAIAQRDLQTNLVNAINATGKFHARMGLVRTSTESFTHALETNKLSMREYFRYAGGATTSFRKLFAKEFDTINQVAQDRVKRMQTQYIKLGRDASGAMKAISITPTTLNMKDYGTQTAIAAQRQALLNQLLKQGSTNLLNFGKNTQWAGRQLMVGFTIPLAYFGTAAAKTFMDLEAQALKFRRVYGDMFTTTEETNKALGDIEALAKQFTKYGVAVSQTMEMAAKAAAMGKVGADLTEQVANATRLSVLGGVEQEQALETTISLTNAFGIAAEELTQKINFLNAVENQTVVSIEDLTIAIPKAGPVVKQLGGSVEDLAFFLTAMREGGINASEGANALKSGLASLINPTDKASKMLAEMGINITGIVEANKGNVRGVVVDFARALDTLDPLNRARAIEQLFGKFQFSRLSTLFQNVTKDGTQASKVLDLATNSVEELAILSERELKKVEDAIGTNFKAAVENLKVSIAPIGKEFLQAVTPVVKFLSKMFEGFNNLGDGTKKFLVIATALVGLIGPTFLMTFGLFANAIANIIKLFALMRNGFLRLGGNSKVLADQTNYLTREQMEATTVAAALDQAHNRLTQRFTSEAAALEALRAAFDRATAAQTRFAAANPGMMIPGFKGKGAPRTKFASGTTEVVGGEAGKDSVPSLLMPGEAVIPTDIAQDERFKPIIAALVTGEIAKYEFGTTNAGKDGRFTIEGRGGTVYEFSSKTSATAQRVLDEFNKQVREASQVGGVGREKAITTLLNRMIDKQKRAAFLTSSEVFKNIRGGEWVSSGSGKQIKNALSKLDKADNLSSALRQREVRAVYKELVKSGVTDPKVFQQSLQKQASHLMPVYDDAGNRIKSTNPLKWMRGQVINDMGILNNYLNRAAGKEFQSTAIRVLKDSQASSALGLNANQVRQLERDLAFARSGNHPINPSQLEAIGRVAELDKNLNKAGFYQKSGLAKTIYQAAGVGALVKTRLPKVGPALFYKDIVKRVLDLETKKAATEIKVGVKPGQKLVDARTGRTVPPKPVPLTAGDKSRIPMGQRLSHSRGMLVGRGKAIPPLGATAETGFPSAKEIGGKTAQQIAAQYKISLNQAKKLVAQVEKETKARATATRATNDSADSTRSFSSKANMAVGAVSGLTIAASFAGGKVGEMAQKIMPFVFGLQGIMMLLPMMKTKMGAFTVGVAAAVTSMAALRMQFDKARRESIAQSQATGTSTKAIQGLAEFANKVSASEIMDRRRGGQFSLVQSAPGKTTFGEAFIQTEGGKGTVDAFAKQIAQNKGQLATSVQDLTAQLSTAVVSGALSVEQARSVAANVADQLGNMSLGIQVNAKLNELLGPNGENVLESPLNVGINLAQQSRQKVAASAGGAKGSLFAADTQMGQRMAVGAATLTGAGVGAAIGSAVPIVGTAIGAAIGSVVGAGAAYFANKGQAKKLGARSGALVGDIMGAVQQQKQLQDALDIYYQKKIQEAQTEGNIAKAKELQLKYDQEKNRLAAEGQKLNDQILQTYKNAGSAQEAILNGIKEQTKERYKSQAEGMYVGAAQDILGAGRKSGTLTSEQEALINVKMASGTLSPSQVVTLFSMFEGKKAETQAAVNIITKFGDAAGMQASQILGMLVDKQGNPNKQLQSLVAMKISAAADSAQAQSIIETVGKLAMLGGVMDADFIVNYFITNPGAYNQIQDTLNQVDQTKDITVDLAYTINPILKDDPGQINDAFDEKYFGTLKDEAQQKTYTKTVSIIANMKPSAVVESDDFKKWTAENIDGKYGGARFGAYPGSYSTGWWVNEYAKDQGIKVTQAGGTDTTAPVTPTPTPGAGKGRDTHLDDLLKKLKFVRKASINAEGGIKHLQKITSGKGITGFGGVQQQLLTGLGGGEKGGFNREFISFLETLDNKTRNLYMKIGKNGKVILKPAGEALKEAFNEKVVGEFQVAQVESIQNTKAQNAALLKLAASGVDSSTALEMVSDANLAVAINSKNISSEELRRMAADAKAAKDAMKQLNLEVMLLADKLKTDVGEAEDTLKALYIARGAGITDPEMLDAISQDYSIVTQILNKGFNDQTVQSIIASKNALKALGEEAEAVKNPAKAAMDTFLKLKDAAFEMLDAQEAAAQSQFDTAMNRSVSSMAQFAKLPQEYQNLSLKNAMKMAEDQIQGLNNQIQKIQDTKIRPIELKINAKQGSIDDIMESLESQARGTAKGFTLPAAAYDDIAQGLKDTIANLELEIELNFSRPIAQLQEESSDLSNELTLMDRVADQITSKYDAQAEALQKVSDINQEIASQEKGRLDVATALSQGDIAAAARAMQEQRAQAAAAAAQRAGGVLDAAKKAEISGLRSATGMTREQIEERQFQISQQIFQLEEQSEQVQTRIVALQDQLSAGERAREAFIRANVLPLQNEIRDLEKEKAGYAAQIQGIETQILAIQYEVLEPLKTEADFVQKNLDNEIARIAVLRAQWAEQEVALKNATTATDKLGTSAQTAQKAFEAAFAAYDAIKSKTVTITVQTINVGGSLTGTGTGTGSTSSSIYGSMKAKMYGGKMKGYAGGGKIKPLYRPMGGLIPYADNGGFRPVGSDTVPAMLTPGEYVVNKASTKAFFPFLSAINESKYPSILARKMQDVTPNFINTTLVSPSYNVASTPISSSPTNIANAAYNDNSNTVYNYNVGISVGGTSASPDSIAQTVMNEIKYLDSQRVRKQRVS